MLAVCRGCLEIVETDDPNAACPWCGSGLVLRRRPMRPGAPTPVGGAGASSRAAAPTSRARQAPPQADARGGPATRAQPRSLRLGLTTSQAANHLGVSMSTIRRWYDTGYLTGYRTPGGQRRFSREQLDAFVAKLSEDPIDTDL